MQLSHSWLLLVSVLCVPVTSRGVEGYRKEAFDLFSVRAVSALHNWYNETTGLWQHAGWWNCANMVNMLADFNAFEPALNATLRKIFNHTYIVAPTHNPTVHKSRSKTNSFHSVTTSQPSDSPGYLNGFYDDEGWWALAWLKVYDITKESRYLETAIDIFKDMTGGYHATCGGIWWDKGHHHNTAIANELFLAVAVQLALRVPHNRAYYEQWSFRQWDWFSHSGMIGGSFLIHDGMNLTTCRPIGGAIFTYTHGVIVGALLDLNSLSPNRTLVAIANNIATAAIQNFSDKRGILHETACEPNCGVDASQFKGIFVRNLQRLQVASPNPKYTTFIGRNALSIWNSDRGPSDELGLVWSGPYERPYENVTTAEHSSACDALIAAAAVAKKPSIA